MISGVVLGEVLFWKHLVPIHLAGTILAHITRTDSFVIPVFETN